MRIHWPLVMAAGIAAVGCGQEAAPSDSAQAPILVDHADSLVDLPPGVKLVRERSPDEPDRVDRTPHVSDDPREIAAVRTLHEHRQKALYEEAFQELRRFGILVSRYRGALERRKPEAVAELRRMMNGDSKDTDQVRAHAARTLIELGDPSGEAFLFEAVHIGRGAARAAALKELNDWRLSEKVDLSSPGRTLAVLQCLDDPDPQVIRAAANLCASKKVPGAEAKLVKILDGGQSADRVWIARNLAEIARGPEAVRVIRDELLRGKPWDTDPWSGFVLKNLIENPDPKVSGPIRAAFLRRLLGHSAKQRYDQGVVRDLASVADQSTVPVLEDIFTNARDPVSRSYALEALARLEPQKTLDRTLEFARARKDFSLVMGALEKVVSGPNVDRIIETFLEVHKPGNERIRTAEVRFLIERLGLRGRKLLEESLGNVEPVGRSWATWKLKGLTLDAAIDDLRAAGIIKLSREAILESMRRGMAVSGRPREIDQSDPGALMGALSSAGVQTAFDVETDELPCNHDELIMEFAQNTRGVFDPECAVQTWHQKDQDDYHAPYTVQFLYKGRLYRFGAENRGDWYDVEAVKRAMNYALETAGRKERFIGLETGDQTASFVFADPAGFGPIAVKYGLVLSNDPGTPERQGKAFERKVIEQLKREQRR